MFRVLIILGCLFLNLLDLHAVAVPEKMLICGICKDVEQAIPNTIQSATKLGVQFLDYRVIVYENNSKDKTKELFQEWAKNDRRVIFLSEDLSKKKLASQLKMKVRNRTEMIARARNKVLDVVMQHEFKDYKYVIWVDLDILNPWDIPNIIDTILHPEQDWDAVLANGAYDLFAFRDPEFPIGFELIGEKYWRYLDRMRLRFSLDPNSPWKQVYSAFGGLGIYKRKSIEGCRYSGVVTKDLETAVTTWLEKADCRKDVCFLDEYQQLLSKAQIIDLDKDRLSDRKQFPRELGIRLRNENGMGKIVWFSCTRKRTLPWTCEHVPFHASMILRGHDKIFINPRLISEHP
jgi:glycosyltransferase involved in cell wall biosynthesis